MLASNPKEEEEKTFCVTQYTVDGAEKEAPQ
jgi:hypothetical protein